MKKKWPLFILIPLLIVLILSFTIYLLKSPKKINDGYVGTQYTFQNVQFNTVSTDFVLDEEVQNTFEEAGYYNINYYSNSGDGRLVIYSSNEDNFEFIETEWEQLMNPFKVIYIETYLKENIAKDSEFHEDDETPERLKIKTFYTEEKRIIYNYHLWEDGTESRYLDILLGDDLYTILLVSDNAEGDIQEIIKSINLIN